MKTLLCSQKDWETIVTYKTKPLTLPPFNNSNSNSEVVQQWRLPPNLLPLLFLLFFLFFFQFLAVLHPKPICSKLVCSTLFTNSAIQFPTPEISFVKTPTPHFLIFLTVKRSSTNPLVAAPMVFSWLITLVSLPSNLIVY